MADETTTKIEGLQSEKDGLLKSYYDSLAKYCVGGLSGSLIFLGLLANYSKTNVLHHHGLVGILVFTWIMLGCSIASNLASRKWQGYYIAHFSTRELASYYLKTRIPEDQETKDILKTAEGKAESRQKVYFWLMKQCSRVAEWAAVLGFIGLTFFVIRLVGGL